MAVEDDGRGLDDDALAAAAVACGQLSPEAAARSTAADCQSLALAAGISTAGRVSTVAGRGLGLALVATRLRTLGGQVTLASSAGRGTTVSLRLPFTLIALEVLLVRDASRLVALPLAAVSRIARLEADAAIPAAGADIRLATTALRWVRLAGSIRPPSPGAPVVILAGADGWRGLAVDEVIGVEEVLVRPLRATIDGLDEATGEALVASGEPAPVIDPDWLGGQGPPR